MAKFIWLACSLVFAVPAFAQSVDLKIEAWAYTDCDDTSLAGCTVQLLHSEKRTFDLKTGIDDFFLIFFIGDMEYSYLVQVYAHAGTSYQIGLYTDVMDLNGKKEKAQAYVNFELGNKINKTGSYTSSIRMPSGKYSASLIEIASP